MKTNKQLYRYYKTKERHWVEAWADCYNRRFEILRTLAGLLTFIIQIVTLLKVFGKI